ncbi:MAG: hypothetical protein KDD70_06505 [Bdellovibrionales bacterium]|nr:hypothetical protein [Bdellovibrionales bacterium]
MRSLQLTILALIAHGAFINLSSAEVSSVFRFTRKDSDCVLLYREAPVRRFDCSSNEEPALKGYFNGKHGEATSVLIVQEQPLGNACNGGPIHLIPEIENKRIGAPKSIDFCGGQDPIFAQAKEGLVILIPGGPPNRGEGTIPSEVWLYDGVELVQYK